LKDRQAKVDTLGDKPNKSEKEESKNPSAQRFGKRRHELETSNEEREEEPKPTKPVPKQETRKKEQPEPDSADEVFEMEQQEGLEDAKATHFGRKRQCEIYSFYKKFESKISSSPKPSNMAMTKQQETLKKTLKQPEPETSDEELEPNKLGSPQGRLQ
jgi:hypothetical protein